MQTKLLDFHVYATNKAGEPLKGEWGEYRRLSAKFDLPELNGEWASCNVKPTHPATRWQPNQFVEIESFGKKNGYWNFTIPKVTTTRPAQPSQTGSQLLEKLFTKINAIHEDLHARVDRVEKKIDLLTEITKGLELGEVKELEEKVEEILEQPPF